MKKTVLALTTAMLFNTTAFAAVPTEKEQKRNEAIGFGSGLVAGALVGGPIGAILGATFGVLLVDDVNDEHRLTSKQAELVDANAQLDAKQSELVALHKSLVHYREKASQLASVQQHLERLPSSLSSNIQFRTASANLEPHYQQQLDTLADSLLSNPALSVSLTGFADQRGDDGYNLSLSEQRVERVRQYLLDKGVDGSQIIASAKGEQELVNTDGSNEGNFFDRRVMLNVVTSQTGMMAQAAEQ